MARAGYKPVIEYCGGGQCVCLHACCELGRSMVVCSHWSQSEPAPNCTPCLSCRAGTELGGGYFSGSLLQPQAPSVFSTPTIGHRPVLLVTQPDGQQALSPHGDTAGAERGWRAVACVGSRTGAAVKQTAASCTLRRDGLPSTADAMCSSRLPCMLPCNTSPLHCHPTIPMQWSPVSWRWRPPRWASASGCLTRTTGPRTMKACSPSQAAGERPRKHCPFEAGS